MGSRRKVDSRTLIVAGALLIGAGVALRMIAGHVVGWYIGYLGSGDAQQLEVFNLLLSALDSILLPLGCALVAGGLVVIAVSGQGDRSD